MLDKWLVACNRESGGSLPCPGFPPGPSAPRSLELIAATLINAHISTTHAAARLSSVPAAALCAAALSIRSRSHQAGSQTQYQSKTSPPPFKIKPNSSYWLSQLHINITSIIYDITDPFYKDNGRKDLRLLKYDFKLTLQKLPLSNMLDYRVILWSHVNTAGLQGSTALTWRARWGLTLGSGRSKTVGQPFHSADGVTHCCWKPNLRSGPRTRCQSSRLSGGGFCDTNMPRKP